MAYPVTMRCGFQTTANVPWRNYCNQQCQGFFKKKPKAEKKPKVRRALIPGTDSRWASAYRSHHPNGYVILTLLIDGVRYQRMEHVVIWERERQQLVPPGFVIHHRNDVRNDNRIENLFCMTQRDHVVMHSKLTALRKQPANQDAATKEAAAIMMRYMRKSFDWPHHANEEKEDAMKKKIRPLIDIKRLREELDLTRKELAKTIALYSKGQNGRHEIDGRIFEWEMNSRPVPDYVIISCAKYIADEWGSVRIETPAKQRPEVDEKFGELLLPGLGKLLRIRAKLEDDSNAAEALSGIINVQKAMEHFLMRHLHTDIRHIWSGDLAACCE